MEDPFPFLGHYMNTPASFLQSYKSEIVTNEMKAQKVWKLLSQNTAKVLFFLKKLIINCNC